MYWIFYSHMRTTKRGTNKFDDFKLYCKGNIRDDSSEIFFSNEYFFLYIGVEISPCVSIME